MAQVATPALAAGVTLPKGTKTLKDGSLRLPSGYWLRDDGTIGHARLKTRRERIVEDWQLYTFLILPVAFFLIFKYVPMLGNIIAFREYRLGDGYFGHGALSLKWFERFIQQDMFWTVFTNNLIIGLVSFAVCFPLPIVLALLLNEIKWSKFKRFVQTVSYMPHFLSVVVVVAIIWEMGTSTGIINTVIRFFNPDAVAVMSDPNAARPVYWISEIWQTTGWGTILYLAALTTIDDQLYEASRIDGAGRWRQTWHITLPGIRHTIVVLFTLNIGTFLAVGFEKLLLIIQNGTYLAQANVISTYVYQVGLASPSSYALGAAIGLFEAVIGLTLVLSVNALSRRLVGSSLW
ncbi:MAG: ABC transporter permease subunit [Propionibacteriaceae bacterium]|nr:ABC transporter permease subunit [Propionibacteriaceae bacterium]